MPLRDHIYTTQSLQCRFCGRIDTEDHYLPHRERALEFFSAGWREMVNKEDGKRGACCPKCVKKIENLKPSP